MPKQTQITKHCCIQGWSGVAEWSGVSLRHIVGLCRPLPSARYVVFYAFDNKSTSEPHAQGPGYFYGTIRLELAEDPQTILAYEMNGATAPRSITEPRSACASRHSSVSRWSSTFALSNSSRATPTSARARADGGRTISISARRPEYESRGLAVPRRKRQELTEAHIRSL